MNIMISGSRGLVGSSLLPYLGSKGHSMATLVRHKPTNPSQIFWDPPTSGPLPESLEGKDAVVHLAGESIASGRWTDAKKREIRDSRVIGTRLLSEALARMKRPPQVLVCASAIGYYGDRGSDVVKGDSGPGIDFFADGCMAWVTTTAPAFE